MRLSKIGILLKNKSVCVHRSKANLFLHFHKGFFKLSWGNNVNTAWIISRTMAISLLQ
jgi:hypothetical protein